MNTTALSRQYDKLTPRERFALLVAAAARGDDTERTRLLLAAPPRQYTVSDHHGVVESFTWLSDYHFTALLDLAACYLEAFAEVRRSRTKDDEGDFEYVLALGYLFQTYLRGWRRFCADLHVDPEHLWQQRPGYSTVQRTEQLSGTRPGQRLPGAAFVQEGMARWLLKQGRGEEAVPDDGAVPAVPVGNAEDMAAHLHAAFDQLLEQWG
jgi:hypothetical protein